MQLKNEIVELKSDNFSFILNIFAKDYQQTIDSLKEKFDNATMFKGITINNINAENLNSTEIDDVKKFLNENFDIKYKEKKVNIKSKQAQDIIEISRVNKKNKKVEQIQDDFLEDDNYKTKIIKNSLRSGSRVSYDGNILVIGDVNAGAELVASGNIIVLGILRGFANAGARGDKDAIVIANKIIATQIRIANIIAIPPKDDKKEVNGIQIASIDDKEIKIQQLN